jgi:DtxR family Mn-dependent transcriptional regulator
MRPNFVFLTRCGHPTIPPGRCCNGQRQPIEPLVIPLKELKVGQSGRIVFITPRTKRRLSRLASYGVIPGSELTLNQRFPSYVIRIDQTDVALETEIAKEILVKVERG